MDSLAATILAVIEQAAISGLYRKEQLQIGVQKAHTRRPDLSNDALLGLAKAVQNRTGARHSNYIARFDPFSFLLS